MTISNEQRARMTAMANELGEFFAKEPDRKKMLLWLDEIRRSLAEECDPVGSRGLYQDLDTIDALLDLIEARRSEIRSARVDRSGMPPTSDVSLRRNN
jgi:hypothetical protein